MSHLRSLGLEIARVVGIGLCFDRELLNNVQTVSLQADHLFRIVGQKTDATNTEVNQYLRAGTILTEIHREPQFFVASTVSRPSP
jgi:hypothetical protein